MKHKLDMDAVTARKQALADYKKDYKDKPPVAATLAERVAAIERVIGLRATETAIGGGAKS